MPAITLYIQAHGSEDIEIKFKDKYQNNTPDVNLFSFTGELNSYGKGARINGISVDEYVVEGIQAAYKEYGEEDYSQEYKYQNIGPYIKALYEPTGLEFGTNAFAYTYPQSERNFYFRPGQHENCRSCTEKGNKRCTQLPENEQWCPNYGLYVVCTDDPADNGYTLATVSKKNKELANILTKNNTARFRYWTNKMNDNDKVIISAFRYMRNQHTITLSFLIDCFGSMGFNKYYILDPTCRGCSTWGSEKTQEKEPKYIQEYRADVVRKNTKAERNTRPPPEPESLGKMSTKDWFCNAAGYCILAAGAVAGATKMAGYWGGKTRHNKKQNRKTRHNKKQNRKTRRNKK